MAKDYCGHYHQAYVGYSTNDRIRNGGSSGGVITELLLYLLESGKIDGAIVTKIDESNPLQAVSFIAKSSEEIYQARQSKYIVLPVNKIIQSIQREKGRYAFVGLPCHIHGLRKWSIFDPTIKERIPYAIGLFCFTTLESYVIRELLQIKKVAINKVKDIRFREGLWPGKICAVQSDNTISNLHYSNFKDGAINYLTRLYSPVRCQMCIDGTAEFADISVADSWMRNQKGQYKFPSMSTVLIRTEIGNELFRDAVKNKRLWAKPIDKRSIYYTYKSLEKTKKKNAAIRVQRMQKKGKSIPIYEANLPECDMVDKIRERMATSVLELGKSKVLRMFILRILLSKATTPLIVFRQLLKKKKK